MRVLTRRSVFYGAWLISVFILLFIGGCVPVSGTYYHPTATVGEVLHEGGSNCGPATRLKMARRGVLIWVSYSPMEQTSLQSWPEGIGVRFRVPAQRSVIIDIKKVEVSDSEGRDLSGRRYLYYETHGSPGVVSPVHRLEPKRKFTTLSGKKHALSTGYSEYQVFMKLKASAPSSFTVTLPKMRIGDKTYAKTVVIFKKTTGYYMAGLGC